MKKPKAHTIHKQERDKLIIQMLQDGYGLYFLAKLLSLDTTTISTILNVKLGITWRELKEQNRIKKVTKSLENVMSSNKS